MVEEKKSKKNFDKQLLTRYVQTECERQLVLDLSKTFPEKWLDSARKPKPPERFFRRTVKLEDLGRNYEQLAYRQLITLANTYYKKDKNNDITKSQLDKKVLEKSFNLLSKSPFSELILLEYEFENPVGFFKDLFKLKQSADIPVKFSNQRPDIIFIRDWKNDKLEEPLFELKPNGKIREIPQKELEGRLGISIIDIKNIRENKIGKKQFTEILYYLWTMAYFLDHLKLTDKFFVCLKNNGIFPHYAEEEINNIKEVNDIIKHIIKLHWNESNRIFLDIIQKIKNLWGERPLDIKDIEINMQINCGFCYYIEDCKKILGINGKTPPEDWSHLLLPYTSMSIAQQLKDREIENIGQVAKKIEDIEIGSTPEPLYAEIPLLKLKANALVEGKEIIPNMGDVISYSIPKYTSISVSFAVETDPANQRVYGAGIYMFMSVNPNVQFSGVFNNWWRIWKEALDNSWDSLKIMEELNKYLFNQIDEEEVAAFLDHLNQLKRIKIVPKGTEKKNGEISNQAYVFYQFGCINEDYTDDSEAKFAKKVVDQFYQILELSNIVENYVVVEGFNAGEFFGPTTGLFYWSKRQKDNFQEMLERVLDFIVEDPDFMAKFDAIISFFNPSDSEVTHPYQHKKLFNVQEFVETVFGFPAIISYTWHEIAEERLGSHVNPKYWIPHFNYMDFNNWHEYLDESLKKKSERNDVEAKERKKDLLRQLLFKVTTINFLRSHFQQLAGNMVSPHSRVISDRRFRSIFLERHYHPISQIWYLFSKYMGAMDELETETIRTTYPEFSIGKLSAGKVSNLQIIKDSDDKVHCMFNLTDLSSNMKVDVGDRVYLLPNSERGMKSGNRMRPYEITISEMVWYQKDNGYIITTERKKSKALQEYIGKENNNDWYLYPISYDSWSKKLYDPTQRTRGLLQNHSFGTTWLGRRLTYLWQLGSNPKLKWPEKWEFNTPNLYLFSPNLINSVITQKNVYHNKELETNIEPEPDSSQREAINNALAYNISAIQGPPGTGKSQTIAALIDEYCIEKIKKEGKPVKILVTSFSYAAIRVIIEKIQESKDKAKNTTLSASLQLIFLRSQYQKPIEDRKGCRPVDDLMRKGGSWRWNGQTRVVTNTKPLEDQLEESFILFGNAHQLFRLTERVDPNFSFDLIVVDEASQLPVDYFMSSLQFIRKKKIKIEPKGTLQKKGMEVNSQDEVRELEISEGEKIENPTKVIIVGDYNQLPPVFPVEPPKNLQKVLDSLFSYYVISHEIPSKQLKTNYRSHKDIVEYTSQLGLYHDLKASKYTRDKILEGDVSRIAQEWVRKVLDPDIVVGSIIHDGKFEIGVSSLEADLLSELIVGYFDMRNISNKEEEITFWREKVGVVAPHNAQGRQIIRKVHDAMTDRKNTRTHLEPNTLMKLLKSTIYSVEKFQGSDRDFIISSIGISDKDQLDAEGEFIYNLNRFNVLTSRAKSKVILVCSEKFLGFIPNDRTVMEEAAKIRNFALDYCNKEDKDFTVPNEISDGKKVTFRYKD